jgi:hypothetical protein
MTDNPTIEQLGRTESGARGAKLDGAAMESYVSRTRNIVRIV